MTTQITPCPQCGYTAHVFNALSADIAPEPSPGDHIMCPKCQRIRVLLADGTLAELSEEDLARLLEERPLFLAYQQAMALKQEYIAYCNEKFQGMQSPYSMAHFRRFKMQQAAGEEK